MTWQREFGSYQKYYRAIKASLGLCTECKQLAVEGKSRCEKHLQKQAESYYRHARQRSEQRKRKKLETVE